MSTPAGYQSPAVTVAATLPKRGAFVGPDRAGGQRRGRRTPRATVVANPYLDAEAVGEIEVALEALGRQGRQPSS